MSRGARRRGCRRRRPSRCRGQPASLPAVYEGELEVVEQRVQLRVCGVRRCRGEGAVLILRRVQRVPVGPDLVGGGQDAEPWRGIPMPRPSRLSSRCPPDRRRVLAAPGRRMADLVCARPRVVPARDVRSVVAAARCRRRWRSPGTSAAVVRPRRVLHRVSTSSRRTSCARASAVEPGAVRHEYRGSPILGERRDAPSQPLGLCVLAERRIGQQEGRPAGWRRGGHGQFGARAGRRQPHAGQPQIGWVRMLDDRTRSAAWSAAPSDELSQQLTEAGERVVHPNVALAGVERAPSGGN